MEGREREEVEGGEEGRKGRKERGSRKGKEEDWGARGRSGEAQKYNGRGDPASIKKSTPDLREEEETENSGVCSSLVEREP